MVAYRVPTNKLGELLWSNVLLLPPLVSTGVPLCKAILLAVAQRNKLLGPFFSFRFDLLNHHNLDSWGPRVDGPLVLTDALASREPLLMNMCHTHFFILIYNSRNVYDNIRNDFISNLVLESLKF